jgi:hypothetical protein
MHRIAADWDSRRPAGCCSKDGSDTVTAADPGQHQRKPELCPEGTVTEQTVLARIIALWSRVWGRDDKV